MYCCATRISGALVLVMPRLEMSVYNYVLNCALGCKSHSFKDMVYQTSNPMLRYFYSLHSDSGASNDPDHVLTLIERKEPMAMT